MKVELTPHEVATILVVLRSRAIYERDKAKHAPAEHRAHHERQAMTCDDVANRIEREELNIPTSAPSWVTGPCEHGNTRGGQSFCPDCGAKVAPR